MSHELSITVEREGQHFIESSVEPGKVLEGPFGTQEEADRRAAERSREFPEPRAISPNSLFGHDDLVATARRAPAPGPPSSFSESLRSAWEVTSETGRSLSASGDLYEAYEEYLDEVRQHTGKSFPNPWSHEVATRAKVEAMVSGKIKALREADPTVPYRSPEEIRAAIGQDRAAVRQRRAEVARREFGFAATAGATLGMGGAILTDPPVFASMFFGAPWATGLLRAAVMEAGAAGAGELVAQAAIQSSRRQFGEEPDIGEAALAVAIAAGGAGVLAPVVRGGAAGVRALLRRAKTVPIKGALPRAAERFLRRQVELEDTSPFDGTPVGRAEHVERMTEAQVALREGRPARMAETPRATVREDVAKGTDPGIFEFPEVSRAEIDEIHARIEAELQDTAARQRAAAGVLDPRRAEPVGPLPQPSRPPLARRALADESDTPAALAEEAALEARVRAMAEAEPDARVVIEDGDTIRNITARELIEEIDSDARFGEEVTACLGGVL